MDVADWLLWNWPLIDWTETAAYLGAALLTAELPLLSLWNLDLYRSVKLDDSLGGGREDFDVEVGRLGNGGGGDIN